LTASDKTNTPDSPAAKTSVPPCLRGKNRPRRTRHQPQRHGDTEKTQQFEQKKTKRTKKKHSKKTVANSYPLFPSLPSVQNINGPRTCTRTNTHYCSNTIEQHRVDTHNPPGGACPHNQTHRISIMTKLTLELPETAFALFHKTPHELIEDMKTTALVKWYEEGLLSQSKAAEIAGISRQEFLQKLYLHNVSPYQINSAEELKNEIS
jgi:predicted HTH domain antitoxin